MRYAVVRQERGNTLESSSIMLLEDDSKYTVNEYMFVNRFIPLLMSPSPEDFNMAWINEVAGGPHNRVTVLDDSTGEKLFTVPPLRPSLKVSTDGNLQLLIMTSLAENSNIPNQVNTDLELLLKYTPFVNETEEETHKREWVDILKRYGADKFFDFSNVESNQPSSSPSAIAFERVDEWG